MANLIEENMYPLIEENPNKLVPNQKKKVETKILFVELQWFNPFRRYVNSLDLNLDATAT